MLMDNMAYLQQIAGTDNSLAANSQKNNDFFSKIFNIWTGLALGGLAIILIIVGVVASIMNKVDTKDQDLMQQSYFMSSYMMEQIMNGGDYMNNIKNSDLRSMSASFASVLREISLKDSEFLLNKYEIEVDELQEEQVALDEQEKIDALASTLTTGRLNGVLDRTWLREMTLQIAIIRSYQSEIAARTKDEEIQEFSARITSNLDNIYNQFHDFKSPGI